MVTPKSKREFERPAAFAKGGSRTGCSASSLRDRTGQATPEKAGQPLLVRSSHPADRFKDAPTAACRRRPDARVR